MKKFIPFIKEGLVILFIFLIVLTAILYSSLIGIENPLLFWSAIACLLIVTLYCITPLKRLILVIIDIFFRQQKEVTGTITDIIPIPASCFSEKWEKNHIRSTDTDYYLLLKVKGNILVLLARNNDLLIKNAKLKITYARFSHIVLNIKTLNS